MMFISFVACVFCAPVVSAAVFNAPVYSVPRNEKALHSRKLEEKDGRQILKSGSSSYRVQQPLGPGLVGESGHIRTLWDDVRQVWEDGSGQSPVWVSITSALFLISY